MYLSSALGLEKPEFFTLKSVVGVGDVAVSNNTTVTISTYALGSCVALVVYDSLVQAGGLIHIMLPDSNLSPNKAQQQPAMFDDTGIPLMFRNLMGLRIKRERLKAFVAGGASIIDGADMFKIGERNIAAVKNGQHPRDSCRESRHRRQ